MIWVRGRCLDGWVSVRRLENSLIVCKVLIELPGLDSPIN